MPWLVVYLRCDRHDVVVAFDRSPYVVINPAIAADVGPAPVSAESACDSEETAPAQPSSGSSRMAHYMAMRIMRKENYIIALINQGVLDLTIQVQAHDVPCVYALFTPIQTCGMTTML